MDIEERSAKGKVYLGTFGRKSRNGYKSNDSKRTMLNRDNISPRTDVDKKSLLFFLFSWNLTKFEERI